MSDPELWARRASSFGAAAREYADHRPDYAAEAIAWSLAGAEGEVARVLDLAAGTGMLTGGLLAAGVAVTAVDPDPGMLAELHRRLPDVPAVVGTAEAIPLDDGSVDAVLVGTAFHWFDPPRALPEIARVLRPGGVLALLYNTLDESVPWALAADRVARSSVSVPPGDSRWEPELPGFTEPELFLVPHAQRRTAASLTAMVGTHSHTMVISAEERAEVLGRLRAYLDAQPETGDGEFDWPLVTRAARARVAS